MQNLSAVFNYPFFVLKARLGVALIFNLIHSGQIALVKKKKKKRFVGLFGDSSNTLFDTVPFAQQVSVLA